ncbi:MAG: family 10 glycosylhydrolase [Planctomycetes bacterium]|nr:family 10 glycosylhydrolase [Planctomycetota bacterium]
MRRYLLAAALVAGALATVAAQERPAERRLRGVWIPLTDCRALTSPAATAAAMQRLDELGVNVVFPVVWTRGFPLWPSDAFEDVAEQRILPGFEGRDPLRDVVVEAHLRGIEVVPWFEYGFAAGHRNAPGVLLDVHPEWAALDDAGAVFEKNGFRWSCAHNPEVRALLRELVLEVVRSYDVDGVQGDDRLPALPADARPSPLGERELHRFARQRGRSIDLRLRAEHLTEWLAELRATVRAEAPELRFAMAPSIHDWALRNYLQDGPAWVARGLTDAIVPQTYRRDLDALLDVLDRAAEDYPVRGAQILAPGLLIQSGSFVAHPDLVVAALERIRELDLGGEVLFHAEPLLDADSPLADALLRGPWRERAVLPWHATGWRPRGVEPEATAVDGGFRYGLPAPGGTRCRVYVETGGEPRAAARVTLRDGDGERSVDLGAERVGWQLAGVIAGPASLAVEGPPRPPRVAVLVDRQPSRAR